MKKKNIKKKIQGTEPPLKKRSHESLSHIHLPIPKIILCGSVGQCQICPSILNYAHIESKY